MQDRELLALFDELESDRVERKESLADRRNIRQAVCALAFVRATVRKARPEGR